MWYIWKRNDKLGTVWWMFIILKSCTLFLSSQNHCWSFLFSNDVLVRFFVFHYTINIRLFSWEISSLNINNVIYQPNHLKVPCPNSIQNVYFLLIYLFYFFRCLNWFNWNNVVLPFDQVSLNDIPIVHYIIYSTYCSMTYLHNRELYLCETIWI